MTRRLSRIMQAWKFNHASREDTTGVHISKSVIARLVDYPAGESEAQLTTYCGLTVPLSRVNGGPKHNNDLTLEVRRGQPKARCVECLAAVQAERESLQIAA